MKKYFYIPILLSLPIFLIFEGACQVTTKPIITQETRKNASAVRDVGKEIPAEKLSVTNHTIKLNGKSLNYTTTAGYMQMKDESGKLKANLFFVAYVKDEEEDKSQRPITFAFNGGPGASSLWLHLGALGPRRVLLTGDGKEAVPPYKLVENSYTWLDFTDLVFIDPVGTGYSRSAPGVDPKEFYGVEEDIRSVADFIRLYSTRYKYWLSPKFIAGESYGTTRAAGLSNYLQNKLGMNLNGIILISEALNFQTILFTPGNDLPYILFLPSYAATAWYHKRLSPELQSNLQETLDEVEQFALNEYLLGLSKGDALSDPERSKIIEKLANYTSLPKTYIRKSNLRIRRDDFVKELLRSQNRRIGVLDSRMIGSSTSGGLMDDPSMFEVTGPLVAAWNDYVRNELKYENDLPYEFLSIKVNQSWDWSSLTRGLGYVNVAETLQQAMNENKYLKVFIASGYYDLDTPYFATKYVVNHLRLDPILRDNITLAYYNAGHQMYTHIPSLEKLKTDVAGFFKKASLN